MILGFVWFEVIINGNDNQVLQCNFMIKSHRFLSEGPLIATGLFIWACFNQCLFAGFFTLALFDKQLLGVCVSC